MSTRLKRSITAIILFLAALALQQTFVEYRVQPARAASGAPDVIAQESGEIVFLGLTSLPPEPGSDLERFHGRTTAERGLFVRDNYPVAVGAIAGILIPLVLLGVAIFLLIHSARGTLYRSTH